MSHSPTPSHQPSHVGSPLAPPSTSTNTPRSSPLLNSSIEPFSPQSTVSGEDLPDWLLFSPSSSEGRSLALGHPSASSSASSFTDVVKGKVSLPWIQLAPQRCSWGRVLVTVHYRKLGQSLLASWQTLAPTSRFEPTTSGRAVMADACTPYPAAGPTASCAY
jgi:hypothetical protein